MIELDRDSNLYPNGNFVEWHKSPTQADVDGFEIKRHGDENVKVKVILHLDNSPERFKLSPELADVLAIDVETRPGIMMALWQYIKFHQLQDPEDKRNINCDQKLAAVRTIVYFLLAVWTSGSNSCSHFAASLNSNIFFFWRNGNSSSTNPRFLSLRCPN